MSASEEHEAFIKTPKQLITVVVLAFVVPVLLIMLLVKFVGSEPRPAAGTNAMSAEAVEARIAPVAGFQLAGAAGSAAPRAGEAVYKGQCAACHATGAAGAPKFGDKAAWAPRIGSGYDALLNSALKGKGAMAPQGGGEYTDLEVGRAVVYMVNAGGGSLAEPAAAGAAKSAEAKPAEAKPAVAAAAGAALAKAKEAAGAVADKAKAAASDAAANAKAAASDAAAKAKAAAGAAVAKAKAAVTPASGKALYDSACMACHATGAAGAPKVGDKAAWAPRLAAGIDGLLASAIKGKGVMPPRGGKADASDADLRAAIEYMVANSK